MLEHVTIVGGGRVGLALKNVLIQSEHVRRVDVVRRGDPIVAPGSAACSSGPILVCTQNHALAAVVAATPPARRRDLVLAGNGWLAGDVAALGASQLLLYMAARPGGAFADGGCSAADGSWAARLGAALTAGGLACAAPAPARFHVLAAEKFLWACAMWALCASLGGVAVGEAATRHGAEVEALVAELLPLVHDMYAGAARQGYVPREAAAAVAALRPAGAAAALNAYSLSIPDARPSVEMAVREWRWRNGALLAARRGAPTPLHAAHLRRAGVAEELLLESEAPS